MVRILATFLAVLSIVNLSACGGYSLGAAIGANLNRVLHRDSSDGRLLLDREVENDPGIRDWTERNGEPDYLYPTSTNVVHFFYLEEDAVVTFERSTWYIVSVGTAHRPIPDDFLNKLPFKEADRVLLQRKSAEATSRPSPVETCIDDCVRLTKQSPDACKQSCAAIGETP